MSQGMTRREFIHRGLTIVATTATAPSFLTRTALAMTNPWDTPLVASAPGVPDDHVLVVVQMGGGNDGLNTVVPFGDDAYYRARPRLAIPREQVIRLNDEVGLHPRMTRFKELYDRGAVAIVQGVGYPNPSRSHFRSMEIWHTADPDGRAIRVGWIGRYFDSACPVCEQPTAGVNIGPSLPLAMRAAGGQGVTLETPETFQWMPSLEGTGAREELALFRALNAPAPNEPGTIDFLRHTAMNAVLASERVRDAVRRYKGGIDYPNHRFAAQLRLIAQMIAGGLPTRVYYAHMTGFDTHANQQGAHDLLLEQLSTGIDAFYRDLEAQGNAERVVVMAFSEFGRRVAENGSAGTDHGTAAPVFVFGRRIRPGLHGRHPGLTDLVDGDLKHHVDFRAVYATLLDRWLGADPNQILGGEFERVPFLT
ncbi:MAG: DUF1501 domain-containing protein [Armatimonadota bacterium]|nr:DUF1501 domain-containing protein [Armatimonadota bacterium]MDR7485827.1 DUF1501 domain-containing protein [Armatimonadota bacterium]MDR7532124.1 DUF1501 domain-containing protein [Armatimonadota bacterium]MDR7536713.1 DUF1501 domain-containing protein [Armatimonadota bacterium]